MRHEYYKHNPPIFHRTVCGMARRGSALYNMWGFYKADKTVRIRSVKAPEDSEDDIADDTQIERSPKDRDDRQGHTLLRRDGVHQYRFIEACWERRFRRDGRHRGQANERQGQARTEMVLAARNEPLHLDSFQAVHPGMRIPAPHFSSFRSARRNDKEDRCKEYFDKMAERRADRRQKSGGRAHRDGSQGR